MPGGHVGGEADCEKAEGIFIVVIVSAAAAANMILIANTNTTVAFLITVNDCFIFNV